MTFEVERTAADGSKTGQTLTATPDDTPPWTESPCRARRSMFPAWDSVTHPAPHRGRQARLARGQGRPQGRRRHQCDDHRAAQSRRACQGQGREGRSGAEAPNDQIRRGVASWVKAFWCSSTARPTGLDGRQQGHQAGRDHARARPDWYFPRGVSCSCRWSASYRPPSPRPAARLGRHGREHPEHLRHDPQPGAGRVGPGAWAA